MKPLGAFTALLAVGTACAAEPLPSAYAAARLFATDASEQGASAAFRAVLAIDAVVLQPQPVPAKTWLANHDDLPPMSVGAPIAAEEACSGDLGWSAHLVHVTDEGQKDYGSMLNVWRLDADGHWRIIASQAIDLEDPIEAAPTPILPSVNSSEALDCRRKVSGAGSGISSLTAAKQAFMAAARLDAIRAYARWGASDLRLYRDGWPLTSSKALLARGPKTIMMRELSGGISHDGRLAYGYGTAEWRADGRPQKSYWLRVWRFQPNGWRIVVDQFSPMDSLSAQ